MKNKNRILTESQKRQITEDKEKAILESFKSTFNKIKRLDENELTEGGGSEEYPVYHATYGSAINAIEDYATKRGVELDQDEYRMTYQDAFFKPKPGKTKSDILSIFKNGKELKKGLSVQIYNRGAEGNPFELNMYIN